MAVKGVLRLYIIYLPPEVRWLEQLHPKSPGVEAALVYNLGASTTVVNPLINTGTKSIET